MDELPRVHNTPNAPCWLQRLIAKQNAYVDSIRDKAERIYSAPCDFDQPTAKVAAR